MADPFDPARLIDGEVKPGADLGPPRHGLGEPFLSGPIPWAWLQAAASLPGRSLAVGLVIWREAFCRKLRTVHLTLARCATLGVSQKAARRAVRALEARGLIRITRTPGCALTVTILHPPTGLAVGGRTKTSPPDTAVADSTPGKTA